MELSETTQMIFDRVEALAPARIVLDSLSELRLLAQSPLRYRRQILARLAKPYTQAQFATEIAHLLPDGRNGF